MSNIYNDIWWHICSYRTRTFGTISSINLGITYTIGGTSGSKNAINVSHNHTFTGSSVNTGYQSNSHTHLYNDYYANTTSGSTTLTAAQSGLPSHSHQIVSGKDVFIIHWNIDTGEAFMSNGTGTVIRGAHVNTTCNTGGTSASSGHTHSVSNTYTSRTTGAISSNHAHSVTATGTISTNGSSGTNANMPPYLVINIWKRTA